MSAKSGTETLITYGLSHGKAGGKGLTQRQRGNTIDANVSLMASMGWQVVNHTRFSALLRNEKHGKSCRLSLV